MALTGRGPVNMNKENLRLRYLLLGIVLLASALGCASCSDGSGRGVTSRVVRAYGGENGIKSILSYTGRGYLKVLPTGEKVINHHLDLYQDHQRYRETYVEVFKGDVVNKWIWINEGDGPKSWSSANNWVNKPALEYRFLEYRFPMLLEWMSRYQEKAGANVESDNYILNYSVGNLSVEVTVDRKKRFIRSSTVTDSDNNLQYSEKYTDYRRVDGIPFPNRITRSVNGVPYCEFFIPAIEHGTEQPDSLFVISEADTSGVSADDQGD
ncbi:MAG: DUF4292 domain-containing protein [Candidatus Latescibacteria bacterium]|nr:DUF4292 domain-containing protein [bacterium]MBD3423911.1 DUF4292 domain-containing protein [Candidatus Latescibacterota bacterium]